MLHRHSIRVLGRRFNIRKFLVVSFILGGITLWAIAIMHVVDRVL